MESYQSIAIVMGVLGMVLGFMGINIVGSWLSVWVLVMSFIGIVVPLVNTKHSQRVGIVLIVLGIVGNLLFILPGIMALRYKPQVIPR